MILFSILGVLLLVLVYMLVKCLSDLYNEVDAIHWEVERLYGMSHSNRLHTPHGIFTLQEVISAIIDHLKIEIHPDEDHIDVIQLEVKKNKK